MAVNIHELTSLKPTTKPSVEGFCHLAKLTQREAKSTLIRPMSRRSLCWHTVAQANNQTNIPPETSMRCALTQRLSGDSF